MSRYKYDDNLEDSIYKMSQILNLQDYRNNNALKHEAEKIRMSYEEIDDKEMYKKIGMGKETVRQIFRWLNEELKLNLNRSDILEVMDKEDIPMEMVTILQSLQSEALQKYDVYTLERYEEENIDDGCITDKNRLEESVIDEIIQLQLPL